MMTPERFKHYSVGNAEHDAQHWRLLKLMDAVVSLIKTKQQHDYVLDILKQDLVQHFADELQFMEKINYPYIQPHVADHDRLVRQLQKTIDDVAAKRSISEFSTTELESMFVDHIDHHDRQYADFYEKQRAGR